VAIGETIFFKCPHCSKEIVVELKTLEGDTDTIEVYWGKSPEDIEDKRSRAEKEAEEI